MVASYRMQLDAKLPFGAAVDLLDHLRRLGITHLYTSPIFTSVPGSSHFYDGVDPTTVSDELGGEDGFRRLVEQLRRRNMKVIVDMVPNHLSVAIPRHNPWWWQTLRDGPDSAAARFFDIDWNAGDGQVVLPILDSSLDDLERAGRVGRGEVDGEPLLTVDGIELPGGDAERRFYRLETWSDGAHERNYRVFFAVNDLAAVRLEDPVVFDVLTSKLRELIADDLIDGVRLDHVDGLADPTGSIRGYRELLGPDRLLLVEKITLGDEPLPDHWPVDGATGYDFAADVVRLLCHPTGTPALIRGSGRYLGWGADARTFNAQEHLAKEQWMLAGLRPGVTQLSRLAGVDEATVRAAAGAFAVYRTYLTPESRTEADRSTVRRAFARALATHPDRRAGLARLQQCLLDPADALDAEIQRRFQQLTAPVMAKGSEDTAMYRFVPLLALNEVGADPDLWTIGVERFHACNQRRQAEWPNSMLTTSTHDTKRSEDVRARLAALTEVDEQWMAAVAGWEASIRAATIQAVDPSDRLLIWQTIVGTWPSGNEAGYLDRLVDYLTKALREAGVHTTWTDVNDAYEDSARALLTQAVRECGEAIDRFVDEHVLLAGRRNSLIQVTLRCLSPGFGDLYRGCETWDLSLVDPDNRRRVDWAAVRTLSRIQHQASARASWADSDDGLVKTIVIARCLQLRRANRAAFGPQSTYRPLDAGERIVAFARGDGIAERVVAVAPLCGATGSVALPPGSWVDVFTGAIHAGNCAVESLTEGFPVAVLSPEAIHGDRPG